MVLGYPYLGHLNVYQMILILTDFKHDLGFLALQFWPDVLSQLRSLLFVGQSWYHLLISGGSTNLLLPHFGV